MPRDITLAAPDRYRLESTMATVIGLYATNLGRRGRMLVTG
jgi:hypothetical protein